MEDESLFPDEKVSERDREESKAVINLDLLGEQLKKKRKKNGIINIIGLCIQKIEFAILSSVNYLAIYYVYYLHTFDENISKENSLTLSSILVFSQFSTIFIGGILQEYIGIRSVMIIGAAFLILGSIGIIFFKNLMVYKIMMLFYGMGIGIPGSITNANASQFIPEKKGLINGIANIAWTLSCSLFCFVGLQIANPHNLVVEFDEQKKAQMSEEERKEYFDYDPKCADNIITFTIIIIFLFVAFSISSTILTFSYRKEDYIDQNGEKEEEEKKDEEKKEEENKEEINEDEGKEIINGEEASDESKKKKKKKESTITFVSYLKTWRFYTSFFLCSFKGVHANLIVTSFQVFAIHYDSISTSTQKLITSTSFIVNLITTTLLSFFVDKFKYRHIIIPTFLLCITHALTFQFVVKNGLLHILYFYLVGVFSSIDNLATFPHYIKIFGARFIVIIFGIFSIGTGLFNFAMNTLVDNVLSGKPKGEEYDKAVSLLFYVSAIFTLISMTFMTLENEKPLFPDEDE